MKCSDHLRPHTAPTKHVVYCIWFTYTWTEHSIQSS